MRKKWIWLVVALGLAACGRQGGGPELMAVPRSVLTTAMPSKAPLVLQPWVTPTATPRPTATRRPAVFPPLF